MNIEHLKNYCYLIGRSKDIGYNIKRFFIFNTPIIIFRDKNKVLRGFVDYCPHRGVPLSKGRLIGNRIKCCYHGWEFGFDGMCKSIPALDKVPKFCLKKIYIEECKGYIFASLDSYPYPLYDIPELSSCHHYYWKRTINGDLINILENFLDATHTPFVHKYLIRNPKRPQKVDAQIECLDHSIAINYTGEVKQYGLISQLFEKERSKSDALFYMPSVAELNYYGKKGLDFKLRTYLTPTVANSYDVHILFYFPKSNIMPGFLKYMIAWPFFQLAFLQDKRMVENQFKNTAYIKEYSPIYCKADLVRKHLISLIVNSNCTQQKSYTKTIIV